GSEPKITVRSGRYVSSPNRAPELRDNSRRRNPSKEHLVSATPGKPEVSVRPGGDTHEVSHRAGNGKLRDLAGRRNPSHFSVRPIEKPDVPVRTRSNISQRNHKVGERHV